MDATARKGRTDGNSPDPASPGARQYLTFLVNDAIWGVPLESVQEVTRMPDVVRVPRSSKSLQGLANLRGRVLPVTSLRRLLRFSDPPPSGASRVIVLNRGSPVGFVVDRMGALVTSHEMESADPVASAIGAEFLTGVVRSGDAAIKILNIEQLLLRDFGEKSQRPSAVANRPLASERQARPQSGAPEANKLVLVSFELGRQEYALPLDRVRAIVPFPDSVSLIPRADTAVLGVTSLREEIVPLLSLHALLGFPVPKLDGERPRVIVVSYGEWSVGLVADRTREILRVDPSFIDSVPNMFGSDGSGELQSICRLNNGYRLVSVLEPDQLLGRAAFDESIPDRGERERTEMADGEQAPDHEQFIIFRLDREDYAVPIGAVDEVTRVPDELTRIPKTPAFVEGLMNLRGTVLPVIDQRRRLDLSRADKNSRQRIIVIALDGLKAGFLVDSVSELLKIPRSAIGPAPELSEGQVRLISRVANLEDQNRLILIVDAPQLLDRDELGKLKLLEHAEHEPAS
jgi:purine-binding chemotaxis protein CheW